jgi:putative transposase
MGYDEGKRVAGRKRHILVDTMGLLIAFVVLSAAVQEGDGIKPVLA